MVADALGEGGQRAAQFCAGMVNGLDSRSLVEPIKQLKRDGHLVAALELCYAAIAGGEGDLHHREPSTFDTRRPRSCSASLVRRDAGAQLLGHDQRYVLPSIVDHVWSAAHRPL